MNANCRSSLLVPTGSAAVHAELFPADEFLRDGGLFGSVCAAGADSCRSNGVFRFDTSLIEDAVLSWSEGVDAPLIFSFSVLHGAKNPVSMVDDNLFNTPGRSLELLGNIIGLGGSSFYLTRLGGGKYVFAKLGDLGSTVSTELLTSIAPARSSIGILAFALSG